MTADPAATSPPEPTPVALDTAVVPLGERSLRQVMDYVTSVGDEAETTYLEVKSELDLASKSKVGVAKIAKFLLGAANRGPAEAARHFHGYAVLVIGAQKNATPGVARGVEPHELEDRLRPYLGPAFPAFEVGRIAVDASHEVLFIIAPPPQDGQSIFPCHKEFQGHDRRDNLEDGAVYVRGASNTRPARAGEILALVERARGGGRLPIDLVVEILGSIGRVDHIDELMEGLYDFEEKKFNGDHGSASDAFAAHDLAHRLDTWRWNRAKYLAAGRAHFLGASLSGVGLRVVSRDRIIAKPHLTVKFHDCELFDHLDGADASIDEVVEPIVQDWSPHALIDNRAVRRVRPRAYPVAWNNRGNDAEVILTPESFRPNSPWTSDQDDYVILVRDPQASTVTVTWELTEEGSDEVTTGELTVSASTLVDAGDLFIAAVVKE